MKAILIRTISGIALAAIAVVTVWYSGYLLAATLFLTSLAAYRELTLACRLNRVVKENKSSLFVSNRTSLLQAIGYLAIFFYYVVLSVSGEVALLFAVLLLAFVVFMAVYVMTYPKYHAQQIMEAYFCLLYAPVMLSSIYLTREMAEGSGFYFVWLIFIGSWVCDTCAYFFGTVFGKHKLAPELSPKKSIEGALGGIAGAVAAGALYGYLVVSPLMDEGQSTMFFALAGGIAAVISQIGDLAASAIKRNYDLKDYGTLIPGHGGVMDRFDSVIFTAPVIYALAVLVFKV
jgi:phosphatidate cytidylyltransferase